MTCTPSGSSGVTSIGSPLARCRLLVLRDRSLRLLIGPAQAGVEQQRHRNEDRGIGVDQDAPDQGQREIGENRTAEEEERYQGKQGSYGGQRGNRKESR